VESADHSDRLLAVFGSLAAAAIPLALGICT